MRSMQLILLHFRDLLVLQRTHNLTHINKKLAHCIKILNSNVNNRIFLPPLSSPRSHIQVSASKLAVASWQPSGFHVTLRIVLLWAPSKTCVHVHSEVSEVSEVSTHKRTVLSPPQEANTFPVGDQATDQTRSVCPI